MSFKLRGRQPEWLETIKRDLQTRSRLLCVAPGGVGKTTLFAALAADLWKSGVRTLVTENRDRLTEQTASRIRAETGLDCDVEMASQRASPYAPIVVASVQSLGRVGRLTGFADDHFGLVVPDECHFVLAPQPRRIIDYFHHGAESLTEGWVRPKDGLYQPRAAVVGFTASPDLGEKRNLGDVFHHQSVNYSYLDAIDDGWLVGIVEKNLPIRIDTRRFHRRQTAEGAEFSIADQNASLIPIIKELASQIVERASDKKTICFLPSVECSRLMAEALNQMGLRAIFVSGECLDKNEKTDAFQAAGPGTVLVNCALYVYGIDFPDVDCICPFSAIISKVNYVQKIYRGTRVLPGIVSDEMTAEERKAAIAASKKPHLLVLSPFFISDRIDICAIFDLFGVRQDTDKRVKKLPDFTKPAEIRDYIKALEKAADKHAHKQARTVNPVALSLALGLTNYVPQTAQEAAPATREELDFLLAHDISSVDVKSSGEAQKMIARLRERERLGLATPKQLTFLKRLGWSEEKAALVKKGQAGAIIGKHMGGWRS